MGEKKPKYGIYVNQAGYTAGGTKRVVFPFACDSFQLLNEKNEVCYRGKTECFGTDEASGDLIYRGDFTDFGEEGNYRIEAAGEQSAPFRIGGNPYEGLMYDLLRAFYFLRCGCELKEEYAGAYKHGICHHTMAEVWEDHSVRKEASGGWHDAGDYGRYITPGACALAHLLYGHVMFGGILDPMDLRIPESGSMTPDILSECRYELEWMCKLQREDGGVYHKISTAHHAAFVMPEEDVNQLYLFPVSSMATADFAAVSALGARVYEKYDKAFAKKLKEASLLSYAWLEKHPEFLGFKNPEGSGTGEYGEWNDYSNRFWAAAELFALTGEKKYEEDMEKLSKEEFPPMALGYAEVGGFGILAYLLCGQEKRKELTDRYLEELRQEALRALEIQKQSGYGVSMASKEFGWGSNMLVGLRGMLFAIADYFGVCPEVDWKAAAQAQLDYLMGINAMGISYVTGNGAYRYNFPHLRPAHADGILECIPGMVSGGPNRHLQDWKAKLLIPQGTPPMKCYADDVDCYSLNEITIYWNSPFVFTLAYLMK